MVKFPYKYKNYANLNETIRIMFNNLSNYNYKTRVINKMYIIKGMEKLKTKYILFNNQHFVLKVEDEDYENFNILSDLFNERCRMKCVLIGRNESPYNYFQQNYNKIVKYCKQKYGIVNNHNLRESVYHTFYNGRGECTSHRPNNIIALMQIFNAKKILDPCAGWGDRLIGAMAGGCDMYVGVDPNECVHKGYNKMIQFFNYEGKAKVYKDKFENFNNPNNIIYDMAYTSPPYFKMEIYSTDNNQSVEQFPTEKLWFDNFLKVLLDKCIAYVKRGGIIAINIGMVSGNTYVYDMLKFMKNERKNKVKYLGIIGYGKEDLRVINPIFIWQTI